MPTAPQTRAVLLPATAPAGAMRQAAHVHHQGWGAQPSQGGGALLQQRRAAARAQSANRAPTDGLEQPCTERKCRLRKRTLKRGLTASTQPQQTASGLNASPSQLIRGGRDGIDGHQIGGHRTDQIAQQRWGGIGQQRAAQHTSHGSIFSRRCLAAASGPTTPRSPCHPSRGAPRPVTTNLAPCSLQSCSRSNTLEPARRHRPINAWAAA